MPATVTKLEITTIPTQRVGKPFTVQGTFLFTAPNGVSALEYMDDRGALKAAHPTVSSPHTSSFSFLHPGITKVGKHTVTLGIAGSQMVTSNSFQVVATHKFRMFSTAPGN